MTKAEINFNQYVNDNGLQANLVTYGYGQPDLISKGGTVTLLSAERRRLTQRVGQYQLFNQLGDCYGDEMTLSELQQLLTEIIENGQPNPLPTAIPYLATVLDLIQLVKQRGLVVCGMRQETYDGWQVVDDWLLCAAIERAQTSDEDQLVYARNADGELVLVDLDDNVVLTEMARQSVAKQFFDGQYYEIWAGDQQQLITEVPLESLGAVLLGILLGVAPTSMADMLLSPTLSVDALSTARLLFGRTYRSERLVINQLTDLNQVAQLPICQDEAHVQSKYQFADAGLTLKLGLTVPADNIVTVINNNGHGWPTGNDDERCQLSDWLVDLAERTGLTLVRSERQMGFVADITDFVVAHGEIVDVNLQSRVTRIDDAVETVFNVLDTMTLQTQKMNLTFEELVMYLLTTAKNNDVNWLLLDNKNER